MLGIVLSIVLMVVPGAPGDLVATTAQVYPNGTHCGHSPEAYGDILPAGSSASNWVVNIDQIVDRRNAVVGFVYGMKDGSKMVQTTFDSSPQVNDELGTSALHVKPLPSQFPSDLRIAACPASQLTTRPDKLPTPQP